MASAPDTIEGASAVSDRFFGALASADVGAARACCAPNAIFWHNFDQLEQSLDEVAVGWTGLAALSDYAFPVSSRHSIQDGLIQRHAMEATTPAGVRIGWPICIFVALRDGLIIQLDEYIDRAGSFRVTEAAPDKNEQGS